MESRKLQAQEWDQTAALVWQVFQEFEAPVYPPEGVESFAAFLRDRQGLLTLDGWASWDGPTLTGVLAARPGGGHICLLFVRADRHRQGVGLSLIHIFRELLYTAIKGPFPQRDSDGKQQTIGEDEFYAV